jgi:hypothetical protein
MFVMEENLIDKRARLYRAVSGLVPGGSFIIEYMIERMPDQRMERLFNFVSELNERLGDLEEKIALESEQFQYLAENAMIASSRAQSLRRIGWIASITAPRNGNTLDIEWEYRQRALAVLNDLSDADVACLMSHVDFKSAVDFERTNSNWVFISMKDHIEMPDHELFLSNLKNKRVDVHRGTLVKHGLLNVDDKDRTELYKLTTEGRLFLYLISGSYPR